MNTSKVSIMGVIRRLIRHLVFERSLPFRLYRSLCKPDLSEWTEYLRKRGGLHRIGEGSYINYGVSFTDPEFVSIGNNVWISSCTIIGHNGAVCMLNVAYHESLDDVGKIDIKDNVFIGLGSIILPGVTIGPNAIVGAGSIVTRDVPPNSIVGGAPARVIGETDKYVQRLKERTAALPWKDLIYARGESGFAADLEPEIRKIRLKHFFGE
jgi:acetyltransferase-like isoleucine patch superfamily enzyme